MDIAKRITELRTQRGLSTNKLANMAGISQSFLRDVEIKNKKISVEILSYLCDALDISLRDFFVENPADVISEDELLTAVNKLTKMQRKTLTAFLNTL